ncbi:MAG TPA: nicotinate phosphoribosyltransferase, partial [Mycobacteriales bacterium]|nr:nicotinate phosphoribosyltransferase [Mycobacteriales bacterium]
MYGLMTDHYELTMVRSALASGVANRQAVFEVFARRLPPGRRYGVVAGTGRLVPMLADFLFTPADIDWLMAQGVLDERTADWLAAYRFRGNVDGYREGEVYFPGSPLLTVSGTFAECVLLETLVLSVLNHDSAVAAAAARMVSAAGDRALVEMGSRRTHEYAALAAARAAY